MSLATCFLLQRKSSHISSINAGIENIYCFFLFCFFLSSIQNTTKARYCFIRQSDQQGLWYLKYLLYRDSRFQHSCVSAVYTEQRHVGEKKKQGFLLFFLLQQKQGKQNRDPVKLPKPLEQIHFLVNIPEHATRWRQSTC